MDEQKAIESIGAEYIKEDGTFTKNDYSWSDYCGGEEITLDGTYDVEELEAFVWWIKNKNCR